LILLLVGAALVVIVVLGQMRRVLRPPRMDDARALRTLGRLTPADVGLPWEATTFRHDGLELAAWRVDLADCDRTVVIVHGYADAKVGALAWAPLWRELGYNLLLVDLRGHGDSGGEQTTIGDRERDDLDAVLNTLHAEQPGRMKHVALFGISLGAVCVAACAVRRDDVDLVVLECPYGDFVTAVTRHAQQAGLPLMATVPWSTRRALAAAGVDEPSVRPTNTIPQIKAKLLTIAASDDVYASDADRDALRAATEQAGGRFEVFDAPHVMGLSVDPERYAALLAEVVR
jgi:pimeloyl-ACP methyl ester carboxylesterase